MDAIASNQWDIKAYVLNEACLKLTGIPLFLALTLLLRQFHIFNKLKLSLGFILFLTTFLSNKESIIHHVVRAWSQRRDLENVVNISTLALLRLSENHSFFSGSSSEAYQKLL